MKLTVVQISTFAGLLHAGAGVAVAGGGQTSAHGISQARSCCRMLHDAGLRNVFLPKDQEYSEVVENYWSLTAQLTPYCFVQPENTQEVSLAVKTLVKKTACRFAIRSGGHSSNAGAANIDDGVTIDLSRLNSTRYDEKSGYVSVQPGARWQGVYDTIDPLGVAIPGARLGEVGVGGSILGGGLSYYLHELGMVCDSVARFEVVLSNGDIVSASADENSDLWTALRGGQGNFGIVTRFDVQSFPRLPLWAGFFQYPKSATDDHIQAIKQWTDNAKNYLTGTVWIFWTYVSTQKKTTIQSGLVDNTGRKNAPAFDVFRKIPGKISGSFATSNISTMAHGSRPDGYRNIWLTITFKNEERLIRNALDLHDKFVEEMDAKLPNGDFQTQAFFQPFPSIIGKSSVKMGGDIMGLDRIEDNAILMLASIAVHGVEHEGFARKRILAWKDAMVEYNKKCGGHVEYEYINYADASQHPYESYGKKNVEKMQKVSAKYDPEGVFSDRVAGVFKVPID